MKQKGIFFIVVLACALWFFGYANQASASSSYYTDPSRSGVSNTSCADCHGSTATCNGCHAHGTHPDSTKSSLNITATTDKTSYQAGETITVTVTGGYRTGWIRVILYDQNMAELARSTGTVAAGAIAPSGAPGFPVKLTGKAPATPGTYTFNASWYGNQYDKSGGFFGARWKSDPNNPGHGEEIVATNSFDVASSTPPPTPAISVTDSVAPATDLSVPFGSVNTGSSANQTVTITNTGTANLLVGAVGSTNPLAAPFSLTNDTCSNQTIAPSASCTLTVAFAPTATGTFSDSFNIPSNDPAKASVTVNVSGTGAAVPTAAITVTDSVAPTTDLQVPFGTVIVGSAASQTVTVKNTGTANLVMGAVGSANPLAAPFTISADTCSNQTIVPAATCTLTIAFAPTSTGTLSDSFSIPSNDPSKSTVTVNVNGTGGTVPVPGIAVTDSVAPTNDLLVPYGTVSAGSSASQTVTITNNGNAALVIGAVGATDSLAAPFTMTNDTCSGQTIAPAATCALTIAFAPTLTGTFTDSFNIPSNDPAKASVTVNLSGTGSSQAALGKINVTDSVSPANDLQIPFGTVSEGRSVNQTVTIANAGGGDLVIGTIASANPLASPFSIASDNCSGKTLSGGSSCTLTVSFTPTAIGTFSDSFDIPSNDPDQPTITMQVNGFGVSSKSNNPPGKPKLRHPADHERDLETSLDMQWDGVTDPDGDHVSYELRISTDSNFTAPMVMHTAAEKKTSGTLFAGTGLGFIFFGVVFAGTARGRKGLLLVGAVVILVGSTLVSCSVGKSDPPTSGAVITQHVSGLQTTTTYYWKVVASDGNGGVAESDVSTFSTK